MNTDQKRRKSHHSDARYRFYQLRRVLRVAVRESGKATMDALIYGTGFLVISAGGEAKRVDPATIWIDTK